MGVVVTALKGNAITKLAGAKVYIR
jgi:hypothetical protein